MEEKSIYDNFDKALYKSDQTDQIENNAQQTEATNNFSGILNVLEGMIKSGNFKTGFSGWQIDAEGNAEFNDGTFRGTFNIGGTTITIDNTKNIQENLDTISAAGGGVLYLQAGTYTLTSNILIPSGVTLRGVSRDSVIINCGGSYSVQMAGTDVYDTGTVALNTGDTTVVGTGTTWTSAMVGRYIFLDGSWYEITAFTDTTHITIDTYQGANLSGSDYSLANINVNSAITKLTIVDAGGAALYVTNAIEPVVDDLAIYNSVIGLSAEFVQFIKLNVSAVGNESNVDFNYVYGFKIDFCEFDEATVGDGLSLTNSGDGTLFDSEFNNNDDNGIRCTNVRDVTFISFNTNGNGAKGIEFVSGNSNCTLISIVSANNISDGVKLTATTDNITMSGSLRDNGGYGINIAAASCDNNILNGINASGNSSGSILDSGTGTLKSTTVNILP